MTQAGKSTAGVLQIPVTATQKSASTKKAPKPPAPRLKLHIRRLPPGLTQSELENALGPEWKVGAGKVDWLQYKPGKVSKDPAKPSRPSRAYIHLISNEHINPLSDRVRQASFQDARHTSNDPVLLGPPSLEFAPYAKTPGNRARKDARQGTIDQDPDFIAFLESLTQPIAKPAPVDSIEPEEKKEPVQITPLVQYIKDKKASKAKENASSKKHGRGEKESKQEKVQAKKLLQRPDKDKDTATTTTSEKKGKGDKASKESAKAAKQAAATTKSGKASAASTPKESTSAAAPERKRERGNVAAAAKILQRDLGLASTSGGRRRGKGGSNEASTPKNESSRDSSVPGPPAEGSKRETGKPGKGGGAAKAKDTESPSSRASEAPTPPTTNPNNNNNAPAKPAKGAKGKPAANPTPTATQAFLKHANPSQGVTEPLLEEAFGVFGSVTKVEIDKKKGFGYVDFAEPGGLQKAMAASPVSVGQSQVVVLERKANPGGEKSRKGRGESAAKKDGGGGGGAAAAPAAGGGGGGNPGSSRGSRGGRGNRKGKGDKAEKGDKGEKGEKAEGKAEKSAKGTEN